MLNPDKEKATQLQEILDRAGSSIKAVWTDGDYQFSFYTSEDYSMQEVKEIFYDLLDVFPELANDRISGGPTIYKEELTQEQNGYYVERT